jgi:putative acetyltransferase
MTQALRIALERPDQPEVIALIEALDAYQAPLYPAESNHLLDLSALLQPEVLFAVARDAQGLAIGCAASVLKTGYAELKRMYVRPECRGLGAAKQLLQFLERETLQAGRDRLMLETGILQPEALGLYERWGFVRRGPFGDYAEDPLSVFMEKALR